MWTLIIYIYASAVALHSVSGFSSEASCLAAASKTVKFVDRTSKEHKFACVKQ